MDFSLLISRAGTVDLGPKNIGLGGQSCLFHFFLSNLSSASEVANAAVLLTDWWKARDYNALQNGLTRVQFGQGLSATRVGRYLSVLQWFYALWEAQAESMLNTLQPSTPTDAPPDLGFWVDPLASEANISRHGHNVQLPIAAWDWHIDTARSNSPPQEPQFSCLGIRHSSTHCARCRTSTAEPGQNDKCPLSI